MGEDWYNNATPEYKWLADVFGAKTKEELDNKVPTSLQNSLTDMYNTSNARNGNPDYDDYTFARAYNDEQNFDQDLYNSIRNLGYENTKFSDMTNDHWNKVLNDYMVGYNDFNSKHPYIPYGRRMEDSYRASWDTSYEGYKGGQEQQAKAPATSQPVAPTQPASNPYADRDAAQQAAAQGDTGNAGTTSPDVNSFAAGKAAPVQPTTSQEQATATPAASQAPAPNPYTNRAVAQQAASQSGGGNTGGVSNDVSAFAAGKRAPRPTAPATPVTEARPEPAAPVSERTSNEEEPADTAQNPTYRMGSKVAEVENIQAALGDFYSRIKGAKIDGDYGWRTRDAVWNWQAQWNADHPDDQLEVSGEVDPETYSRLMKWWEDRVLVNEEEPEPASEPEPKPATPVVEPTRVAQEVPQTTAPNSQASQVQGEARQAVPHYQSRPTASAPDNMPKASRPSYEEPDVRPVNAPRNIFRDYREAEKAQYQPNTKASQPSTRTGQPNTHTAIANTRSRAIMPGSRDKYQPITSMEELARTLGYTSQQEEEKMRRASLMNQRILAVGDALRHIGNIANTVGYAPAQQFNNPVLEEQARYEKGKAMRDRANQQFLTYQQQKAIQDAKARQLEAQAAYQQESLGIRKAEHQRLINAQKLAERKQDFYEKLKQEQYELDKAYKENKMTWEEYNAKSRRISAEAAWLRSEKYVPGGGGGVNGYTTTKNTVVHRDKYGKETGRTTTTTRTGSNGKSSTSTTTTNKTDNPYGGRRHGSGGGKDQKPAKKENKYGVKPAK